MASGNTVFVSSTVYDLLDLRAEVERHLRDLGLVPLLSDSATSGFEVAPNSNSIESCLANVRNADHFVCILSQRYGPSLKDAGYRCANIDEPNPNLGPGVTLVSTTGNGNRALGRIQILTGQRFALESELDTFCPDRRLRAAAGSGG